MLNVDRRTFMKSSAAVATMAMAGTAGAQAKDKIRVGIIGCRNRGHQVGKVMTDCGEFEIVALADCDLAMAEAAVPRVGEQPHGAPRIYQDFRELLEDKEVDAVVNATPDFWHAAITILALEAGKHVYLEKPASYNINDGKAMLAASRQHPELVVIVGTQQRSSGHFKQAKEFIQSGGLGKIGFTRAWITHTRGALPRVPDSDPPETMDYDLWVGPAPYHPYNQHRCHYDWHWVKDYGTGEMGNWGAHWLDISRWFLDLGLPTAAMGLGGTYVIDDIKETPDTQTVLYEYPGITALWEQRLWTSYSIQNERAATEVSGDDGSLVITRAGWTHYPRTGDPVRHDSIDNMEIEHAKNFAACIRGEETVPGTSLEEGLKTSVMCHLGNICVGLKRRVAFDPETELILGDEEAARMAGREYRGEWKGLLDRYLA